MNRNLDFSEWNPSFFYINDECGIRQNLTNDSSFPMIKASQIKGVFE